ncbi:MAG TPA: aminoglycoside phosphotransferase family protein [Acidimicrobiales bacterium]|nr:aminoglycoside phosphotransferase family protein [Acidimicrobiales bacterium]
MRQAAPQVSLEEARAFLEARYAFVADLERLGGGFWSAAFGFRCPEGELVLRFGDDRAWFEADRSAMAFARPGLPVPEVLEVGEAAGRAFAVSRRHHGIYLESVRPDQCLSAGPMLTGLLEALFAVPKSAPGDLDWHRFLRDGLVDSPDRLVSGWRASLGAEPEPDRLFRAAEARMEELLDACPQRGDLVHGDLLHGNVLVTEDAGAVTAVFSWKCSVRGDFLYDVAWCSFWGALHPGIAAAEPWRRTVSSPVIRADPGALVDAASRHHCYELQIGAAHLAWNVWVGDRPALEKNAALVAAVLERGPLPLALPPA